MSYWFQASVESIILSLNEYESQLSSSEEFDFDEAFKYVSSRYPFGQRINHPYKQWLKAVKKARFLLQTYSINELSHVDWNLPCPKKTSEINDTNQLSLF